MGAGFSNETVLGGTDSILIFSFFSSPGKIVENILDLLISNGFVSIGFSVVVFISLLRSFNSFSRLVKSLILISLVGLLVPSFFFFHS